MSKPTMGRKPTNKRAAQPAEPKGAPAMPLPPGIVYWRKARIRAADGTPLDTWLPVERPLAAIRRAELQDADIVALLRQLTLEARARKISAAAVVEAAMHETLRSTHRLAARARKLRPGERATVG
jgi:hypothetical protein